MLERDSPPTKTYGFLVAIEIAEGVSIDDVIFKLSDAVSWYEGCGKIDVELLGPIDTYTEQDINATSST